MAVAQTIGGQVSATLTPHKIIDRIAIYEAMAAAKSGPLLNLPFALVFSYCHRPDVADVADVADGAMLPGLKDTICSEFAMTPNDFKDRYLSVDGAGFSISPYFRQSAWFRFHNRGEGIPKRYVVGAGAHPGAGLPGVVSSAKTLDHLVPEPVNAL